MTGRTGVWLVGGRGSVATTAVTGRPRSPPGWPSRPGCVTERPAFADAGLPAFGDLVFGGHDVVETPLAIRAARARRRRRAAAPAGRGRSAASCGAAEAEQRPGSPAAEARRPPRPTRAGRRPRAFRDAPRPRPGRRGQRLLDRGAVRAAPRARGPRRRWTRGDRRRGVLPPSSLYALAAFEAGCAFVDFTPSVGRAAARARGARAEAPTCRWAGSDGKTGETFMKSALAPMFAARALRVRSWAGHEPARRRRRRGRWPTPSARAAKLASKGRLLEEILGYPVEAPIHIDDVRDMGEWKTAWDHIVFEGFLGVADEAAVHLGGLRLRARRAAGARPGPARGAARSSAARPASLAELAFFFKDPVGHATSTALDRAVRDCSQRWVAPGGRARERAGAAADAGGAGPPARRCCQRARRRAGRRAAAGRAAPSAAHRRAGRRLVVPVPGRDGAQRLRRPRGRRASSARSGRSRRAACAPAFALGLAAG